MTDLKQLPLITVHPVVLGIAICVGTGGCNRGPKAIRAPDWNPDQVAARVIEQLDTSGDGVVDKQEAIAAPSIVQAFSRIDKNANGQLSLDELHDRFAFYERYGTGLMNQSFEVRLNGRPAAGVRIDMLPEPFLEDVIRPASGVTDGMGQVVPVATDAEFPGMQVGLYRVVLFENQSATDPMPGIATIGIEASPLGTRDSSGVLDFRKN